LLELSNIVIEHAGAASIDHENSSSVYIRHGTASVKDVRIANGLGFALDVNDGSNLSKTENLIISSNESTVSLSVNSVNNLGSDVKFSNNEFPEISVNSSKVLTDDVRFSIDSVPYKLNDSLSIDNAKLEVGPGVEIQLGLRNSITIFASASINAIGTSENPIKFTSYMDFPGAWAGVDISSLSPLNKFEHVVVKNAGGAGGSFESAINLTCRNGGASLSLSHTTIAASAGWGLTLVEECSTVQIGNDVEFIDTRLGEILAR